jgi:hypothetical protein
MPKSTLIYRTSTLALTALAIITFARVDLAHAFPLTSSQAWQQPMSLELVQPGFDTNGVVAMSNCSASFVRFKGSSDDAKGLVLTNGHCIRSPFGGMLQPGEVVYQQPQVFQLRLLDRSAKAIATLRTEKIIYGTMTNTDLALLELNQTYRQIRAATGVEALYLSESHPVAGTPIEIPSGYWRKTYSCSIDGFAYMLREGDWTFTDSIRYSPQGCEVVGGTSGSPIWNPATGEVIGINNTTNESGLRCVLNNPCEIDPAGKVTAVRGRSYGQETYILYSCLTAAGFDLSAPGCILPKGR